MVGSSLLLMKKTLLSFLVLSMANWCLCFGKLVNLAPLLSTTPGHSTGIVSSEFLHAFKDWDNESTRGSVAYSFLRHGLTNEWAAERNSFLLKIASGFAKAPRKASAIEAQARAVAAFDGAERLSLAPPSHSLVLHGNCDNVMPPQNAEVLARCLGDACELDIFMSFHERPFS